RCVYLRVPGHVRACINKILTSREIAVETGSEWQPRCYKCKQMGRLRYECPQLRNQQQQQNNRGGRRNNFVMISTAVELEQARDAIQEYADWKLDTGAALHVTDRMEDLTDFVPVENGPTLEGTYNVKQQAVGYGTVELVAFIGEEVLSLLITEVWYVPDLGHSFG
ncbi:hypothetical protein VaNZ11_003556, partial [Volvox africanus]